MPSLPIDFSTYFPDPATGFLMTKASETSFGPKEKTAYLRALKTHGNQSKAAHDLGVSYLEVVQHLRNDLIFKEAYEETLIEMKHRLESQLYMAGLKDRGSKEAKLWLESHFPDEYGTKKKPPVKKAETSDELEALYNKIDKKA